MTDRCGAALPDTAGLAVVTLGTCVYGDTCPLPVRHDGCSYNAALHLDGRVALTSPPEADDSALSFATISRNSSGEEIESSSSFS